MTSASIPTLRPRTVDVIGLCVMIGVTGPACSIQAEASSDSSGTGGLSGVGAASGTSETIDKNGIGGASSTGKGSTGTGGTSNTGTASTAIGGTSSTSLANVADAIRYPADRTQSPITRSVVERMQQILANGTGQRPEVFMKVGDSITDLPGEFMACFSDSVPDGVSESAYRNYGGRPLEQTVTYFSTTLVDVTPGNPQDGKRPSFERVSRTAQVSMDSRWLPGEPELVDQEIAEIHPQVALVMFGTNDLSGGSSPSDDVWTFDLYAQGMMDLSDMLIARGVIPVLSTIPPRTDVDRYALMVPTMNAIVRGVAEARQIPLMDYHRELMSIALPNHGISDDGVHPNTYGDSGSLACNLATPALNFGYNVRNKVGLEALERMRQVLVGSIQPLDNATSERALTLSGTGTSKDPFLMDGLPFTDVRNIHASSQNAFTEANYYQKCPGERFVEYEGPDYVYRMTLTSPARLRAFISGAKNSPIRFMVSVSAAATSSWICRQAPYDYAFIDGNFAAGTYYFTVDTTDISANDDGEYFFAVIPCEDGDVDACKKQIASGT